MSTQSKIRTIDTSRGIGWLASLLAISCAMHIILKTIDPIIVHLHAASTSKLAIKLDLRILSQEIAAYILLVSGIALSGRSRLVWAISTLSFGYLILNNLLQNGILNHDYFVIISFIIILSSYKHFNRQFYLTYSFVFISGFIIFALFYGIFGSFYLRDQFHNLNTISDALYFSIITYSTVGYGDIYPETTDAKMFVLSMVIIGLIMFTSGITLLAYMINNTIKNMLFNINKGKTAMTEHIILCGYGIMAKILIQRYRKEGKPFLVIDVANNQNSDLEQLLNEKSILMAPYPGCKDTFIRARLNEAHLIIICYDSDADTILEIMNVKEFLDAHPKRPKIIARIFYEENVQKASKAGADHVIATNLLVADAISNLV